MFDQPPQTPRSSGASENLSPTLPPRPAAANRPVPPGDSLVDDIFSKSEPVTRPIVTRPIQPGQVSRLPIKESQLGDIYGGRSIWSNKLFIFLLVILILVVIGIGVFLSLVFFKPSLGFLKNNLPVSNQNANPSSSVNATVNTNSASAPSNTNANSNVNGSAVNTNAPLPPQDSDGDGLSDDEEKQLGTDPNKIDTDSDGLIDRAEVSIYKTDPLNKDTDGDGFSDGSEVINGYDPLKTGGARLFQVPQ
ncbi:MAG: hypothetical protein WC518_02995 [Patescibacteria group bacterium]